MYVISQCAHLQRKHNIETQKNLDHVNICLTGGLHLEMRILAIRVELIDGSGLYEILSKSSMSIIGTQNLWTGSPVQQLGIVSKRKHQQSI